MIIFFLLFCLFCFNFYNLNWKRSTLSSNRYTMWQTNVKIEYTLPCHSCKSQRGETTRHGHCQYFVLNFFFLDSVLECYAYAYRFRVSYFNSIFKFNFPKFLPSVDSAIKQKINSLDIGPMNTLFWVRKLSRFIEQ